MHDRVILHSDCNCFYASVELLHHPELHGKPIAVGGDREGKNGIVLTASYPAKRMGVKTGMALWQARQVCPDVIFIPPRMDLYLRFSKMAHEIYMDYTDKIQPYGIDESWLDVTESANIKGDGMTIANEISNRIKNELGITVSIGVSWNKIFAKLGSDYKKPDAITEFTRDNFKEKIWPLPAEDLLYVGPSTKKYLNKFGIKTIGELANTDETIVHKHLGKMGSTLWAFANGYDDSPVAFDGEEAAIKSIGNSTTTHRELVRDEDVRIIIFVLAESVARRLRDNGFKCRTIEISIRDKDLQSFTRQIKALSPTNITGEIAEQAYELFKANYSWKKNIRSVGVRGADLILDTAPEQLELFVDNNKRDKLKQLDKSIDVIRNRFGYFSVQRGLMHTDRGLSGMNALEHTVHPHSYFG